MIHFLHFCVHVNVLRVLFLCWIHNLYLVSMRFPYQVGKHLQIVAFQIYPVDTNSMLIVWMGGYERAILIVLCVADILKYIKSKDVYFNGEVR